MELNENDILHGPRYDAQAAYTPALGLFDVDDTLIRANSDLLPTARFHAAVQAAGEGAVGLVTARQPQKSEHIIDGMGMTGYNVLGNGSVILDAATGDVIEKPLPRTNAFEIIQCLQQNGIPHTVQDDGVDYRWLPPMSVGPHGKPRPITVSNMGPYAYPKDIWRPIGPDNGVVDMEYEMNKPFVIVAHDVTLEDHRHLSLILAGGKSQVFTAGSKSPVVTQRGHEHVQPNGSILYDVFFLHPEAKKEYAMVEIAQKLGLTMEDVMFVGDGPNDSQAVEAAGTGVAMGNAVAGTLEMATHIVPRVEHDGAAIAIEQLLLPRRSTTAR